MQQKPPLEERIPHTFTRASLKLITILGIIIAVPISVFVGIMLEFVVGYGHNTNGIFVVGVPVAVIAAIIWLAHKNKARRAEQYHSDVRQQVMSELGVTNNRISNRTEDIVLQAVAEHDGLTADEISGITNIDKETLMPILGMLLRNQQTSQQRNGSQILFIARSNKSNLRVQ